MVATENSRRNTAPISRVCRPAIPMAGSGPAGGGGGAVLSDANPDDFWTPWSRLAQARRPRGLSSLRVGRQVFVGRTSEITQLEFAVNRANGLLRRVRDLDPDWRATPSLSEPQTVAGALSTYRTLAAEAEARLAVILRDAIPGANPSWGINRLRKELYDMGYVLRGPARGKGMIYENPSTGDKVRVMDRPQRSYRNEPHQKHFNNFYYRYKPFRGGWGDAITIPNKN